MFFLQSRERQREGERGREREKEGERGREGETKIPETGCKRQIITP